VKIHLSWGKGGNVSSAGWQVTPCERIWHVSSRSGVAVLQCELLCVVQRAVRIVVSRWVTTSCVGAVYLHATSPCPTRSTTSRLAASSALRGPPSLQQIPASRPSSARYVRLHAPGCLNVAHIVYTYGSGVAIQVA